MPHPLPDVDGQRPPGSQRSSKREQILNVFLRQEGPLSTDELYELMHRGDEQISRATVYRALRWMVEAGIARKVDLGEGRFRFEHSYRHPRHFHLICKKCNRSSEFLSSDIEALIEEIAAARSFSARQSVLQIYGTCAECRTGRPAPADGGTSDLLFARDALRIAIATERSGLEFYSRAANSAANPRGRTVFQRLADEERSHLSELEARYQKLLARDPQLEARPTFLFFKGAANGLFAAGAEQVARGVSDRQALLIGIRGERASHRFFKRYGERFEETEGRQVFLQCAEAERTHLEWLVREYPGARCACGQARRAPAPRREGTGLTAGGRAVLPTSSRTTCVVPGRRGSDTLGGGTSSRLRVQEIRMPNGTIKRLVRDRGFGFIRDDGGQEWFFHRSAVAEGGFEKLAEGQRVRFDEEPSPKGPRAANVQPEA